MVLFGVTVNWLAVVIGAIAAIIIGVIYYSPFLFGKEMMATTQRGKQPQRPRASSFLGAFIAALFTAFALEVLIQVMHVTSLTIGLELAAVVWLGFYVSLELVAVSFGMRNTKIFAINVVHHALAVGAIAIVLVLMR